MRSAIVTLLCTLGLTASSGIDVLADDKPDAKSEVKKFEGTWTFESIEAGGQKLPGELFKGMTVTFEGDKYSVMHDGKVVEAATQTLDPSKSPKTLDTKVTEGPNKGKLYLCIYEFSGDTVKICFDPEGKKRPAEFKSESGFQVLVMRKSVKK